MTIPLLLDVKDYMWLVMPPTNRRMPCHPNAQVRLLYKDGSRTKDTKPACDVDWQEVTDPAATVVGWISSDILGALMSGDHLGRAMRAHFAYWESNDAMPVSGNMASFSHTVMSMLHSMADVLWQFKKMGSLELPQERNEALLKADQLLNEYGKLTYLPHWQDAHGNVYPEEDVARLETPEVGHYVMPPGASQWDKVKLTESPRIPAEWCVVHHALRNQPDASP